MRPLLRCGKRRAGHMLMGVERLPTIGSPERGDMADEGSHGRTTLDAEIELQERTVALLTRYSKARPAGDGSHRSLKTAENRLSELCRQRGFQGQAQRQGDEN